jgi:membrane protein
LEKKPKHLARVKHALQLAVPPGDGLIYRYLGFLAQGVRLAVNQARRFYHQLDRLSGRRLSMVRRAFRRFSKNRGAESAASISFYTIFSIFPLLIFITSAASTFLDSKVVKESVLEWLTGMLPIVPEVIMAEIQHLIDIRTTAVNLVALIGFLWSASGAFNALARSLNHVWHPVRPRSALVNRLFGLGMVASLVVLVMVLLMSSSMVTMILGWGLAFGGRIGLHLIPIFARTIVFWLAYRLVPGGRVSSTSALLGAFVASLAWDVTTLGFTAFIKRGFVRYEILYGSLGTIIALLFWVFLCCFIFLMGAYIAEADGYRKKESRLVAKSG